MLMKRLFFMTLMKMRQDVLFINLSQRLGMYLMVFALIFFICWRRFFLSLQITHLHTEITESQEKKN